MTALAPRPAALAALLLALAAHALAAEGDPRKPGGGGKFHNQPDNTSAGGITATVDPIDSLEEVLVVEPDDYRVYIATIDPYEKRFTLRGLPPGKYDLILKFRTTVVEGLRLVPSGEPQAIPEKDWKYIQWETWRSDDYFNHKRIVRLAGDPGRVKMLVDQVRDKKTFEPDGTVLKGIQIRRPELTEMRKTGLVWQTAKTRHLYREERRMDAPGRTLKYVYAPGLGGIRVADEMVTLPHIAAKSIPPKSSPRFYSAHHSERRGK